MVSTEVGYTGGTTENPKYEDVHAGRGGHAEAVEVIFDPAKTSYEEILLFFFRMHDPTTLNRQGNDIGVSYRSAIFYEDDAQKKTAEAVKARVDRSGKWRKPIVTEIVAGRTVLARRGRAPGLPGEAPGRLHLPLRPRLRLQVHHREGMSFG